LTLQVKSFQKISGLNPLGVTLHCYGAVDTMSRRQTHLVMRGPIYYHRITVPHSLRELLGRREVWQSLRTSDLNTAKTRAAICEARTRLHF